MNQGDTLTFLICTEWNRGTSSQHFRGIAEELARRGHTVNFVANRPRRELEEWQDNPKAHVWPVHYNHTTIWTALSKNLPFGFRLIRDHRPDCVLVGTGPTDVILPAALAGVPCRIVWRRTLMEAREIDEYAGQTLKHQLARERHRFLLSKTTHIIGNSKATCAEVQEVFATPPSRLEVFYNTIIDPARRYDLDAIDPINGKIVCAGRLFRSKGQDVLLRAASWLRDEIPSLQIEFLGDGPQRHEFERLAEDLGLVDHVDFRGRIAHEEVCKKMREASVVVVPSRAEAFGFVNIEALAVGTPLIASSAGGIREIIDDGVEGFLVPPDDEEALADRLRQILVDDELRSRMSANARGRFAEFDFERSIPLQADRLEGLVRASKSAAAS